MEETQYRPVVAAVYGQTLQMQATNWKSRKRWKQLKRRLWHSPDASAIPTDRLYRRRAESPQPARVLLLVSEETPNKPQKGADMHCTHAILVDYGVIHPLVVTGTRLTDATRADGDGYNLNSNCDKGYHFDASYSELTECLLH